MFLFLYEGFPWTWPKCLRPDKCGGDLPGWRHHVVITLFPHGRVKACRLLVSYQAQQWNSAMNTYRICAWKPTKSSFLESTGLSQDSLGLFKCFRSSSGTMAELLPIPTVQWLRAVLFLRVGVSWLSLPCQQLACSWMLSYTALILQCLSTCAYFYHPFYLFLCKALKWR